MNDDAPTTPAELASAALDGHTTPDERATVEATPALRDELVFYSGLRQQLRDVEVPTGARESALSAALAVFDQIQADDLGNETGDRTSDRAQHPTTTGVAPVVSLQQRRTRQVRWLGGAAAAAVAIVIAAGVVNGISGQDQDSQSTSNETFSVSAAQDSTAAAKTDSAESSAETTSGTTGAATQAGDTAQPAAAPQTTLASAASVLQESTSAEAGSDPWVDAPQLDSDVDVLAFADTLPTEPTEATTAGSTAESTATSPTERTSDDFDLASCLAGHPGPTAAAYYQGIQVFVVDETDSGTVLVIDPVECVVIRTITR